MRTLLLLLVINFLFGCSKSKDETIDVICHMEMKERFKDELKCIETGSMEVNLYSAVYEGKTIYFPMTMCPSCNTIPPKFGLTCGGQKITIKNFSTTVSQFKQIYNSCTNRFVIE